MDMFMEALSLTYRSVARFATGQMFVLIGGIRDTN